MDMISAFRRAVVASALGLGLINADRNAGMRRMNSTSLASLLALVPLWGPLCVIYSIVAGCWALVRLVPGHISLPQQRDVRLFAGVLLLYPAAALISVLVNDRGIGGVVAARDAFILLTFLPVLGRVAVSTRQDIVNLMALGAGLGGIVAFGHAVVDLTILGLFRAEAGLFNPIYLGRVALLLCTMALWASFHTAATAEGITLKRLARLGALCAVGAMLLSGARMTWVTLPIVLLVLALPHWRGPKAGAIRPAHIAAALAVIGVVAALAAPRIGQTVLELERLAAGDLGTSGGQRLAMWQRASELIAARPFAGYGPDMIEPSMLGIFADPALAYPTYHNAVLDAMVSAGVPGLIAILAIPLAAGLMIWRRARDADPLEAAGLQLIALVLICYYVPSLTDRLFGNGVMICMFLMAMLMAMRLVLPEPERARNVSASGS
jgi:O-antigen ligase